MASMFSSCSADSEHEDCHNNLSSLLDVCEGYVEEVEESMVDVEEEEEDTDFNPFLIAESSSEASSSLSSDEDVSGHVLSDPLPRETNILLDHTEGTECHFMEAVKHGQHLAQVVSVKDTVCAIPEKNNYLVLDSQQVKGDTVPEVDVKVGYSNNESNVANNTQYETLSGQPINTRPQKTCTELDDEDAICRRTRAHHSLANYTLEELETFLQESDDEDNLQNVDDEEEYHKFLTAVLKEGHGDGVVGRDDIDVDEDEENDMDFEVEIEEALESDSDDFAEFSKHLKRDPSMDSCGPETRGKRSQNNQKKLVGPSKIPLRPILPSVSNVQAASFLQLRCHLPCSQDIPDCSSSLRPLNGDFIQGFTAQQAGQLYHLMYQHTQLLIQIFSLCVLDPSRQHIAQNVRNMILEMIEKQEEALASKKVPYPRSCFESLQIQLSDHSDQQGCPKGSSWAPSVKNPIFSIFDVATLHMARRYISDVSAAVLKHRDSHVDVVQDKTHMIKQPLFHWCETSEQVTCSNSNPSDQSAIQLSSSSGKHKMSLAAMLVENTKKQCIAHVPKGIADLAQRFVPLFNPALFPRKPPIPAVANRVLFTESEDRLLALGLMEYNNNWGAIQQRFLPCKSKNQIFVRQKNRSSSKSPENPIKTVRRMKTSPLTANELFLISEGLKIFKNDWNAVWRFYVPYRDPSLLPRQWRIATGTQKSYRKSDIVRQKRNSYEAKRRKLKASMKGQQSTSEKVVDDDAQNSTDDNLDEDEEAYVHEAFLADCERGSSMLTQPPVNQEGAFPYQIHKTTPAKVVKLAPGLPPVNLPPSVRVISQSALKSYNHVQPYPDIGDGTSNPQRLRDSVYIGSTLINPRMPENIVSASCPKNGGEQDSNGGFDHIESDHTMHPFLLRTGNRHQAHHQYHYNANTANFLSVHRQQTDGMISSSPATEDLKESPLNLHGIDVHPFLRGLDYVLGNSGIESRDVVGSGKSNTFCASRAPDFNSSSGIINVCEVRHDHFVLNAESSGQNQNDKEIDLDMHLSTRTTEEKGENCLDAYIGNPSSSYAGKNVLKEDSTSGAFGGFPRVYTNGNEGNENSPEIVMEQEELSDSDEEIDKVEFEREEMDDTDEEQLDENV